MQTRYFAGVFAYKAVSIVISSLQKVGRLPKEYGKKNMFRLLDSSNIMGRDQEIDQVVELLKKKRFLWLVAGPGEGKSLLAAAAGKRMYEQVLLPGGAFEVDLAGESAAYAEEARKQA